MPITGEQLDEALADVEVGEIVEPSKGADIEIDATDQNIADAIQFCEGLEPAIQGKFGDNTAYQAACRMRDEYGFPVDICKTIMHEHYHCEPYDADWLNVKIESAYRNAQNAQGSRTALAEFADEPNPFSIAEQQAARAKYRGIAAANDDDALALPSSISEHERQKWQGVSLDEVLQLPDPQMILENVIPSGLTILYSKPKRGKTFFALRVSLSVATGHDFYGMQIGKTGRVLYIAAEGGLKNIGKRLDRMIEKFGMDRDLVRRNIKLVGWGVHMNVDDQVKKLLELNPGKFELVVIDTLARNMKGDENKQQDTSAVIAGIDKVRQHTGADVLLIHHEGRVSGHLRGSTTLEGAPDGILRGSRDSAGTIHIEVEALREGPEGKVLHFRLVDGALEATAPANQLREREEKLYNLLVSLHSGLDNEPVRVKQWKATAFSQADIFEGTEAAKKKQWQRALKYMQETGAIKYPTKDTVIPVANNDSICDDFDDTGVDDAAT